MIGLTDEDDLQASVVDWLKQNVKPHQAFWWHVPNGGYRRAREARQLKNKGVRPGVPDLSFILPPHGRAAYIELKSTDAKGRASGNQTAFRELATNLGALYAECRSVAEVEGTLCAWLVEAVSA